MHIDLEVADGPMFDAVLDEWPQEVSPTSQLSDSEAAQDVVHYESSRTTRAVWLLRHSSWLLYEVVALSGYRPRELVFALMQGEKKLCYLSEVRIHAWHTFRIWLRIWILYMLVRYQQWDAAPVYLGFALWRPTIPPLVPCLAALYAIYLGFGWVPLVPLLLAALVEIATEFSIRERTANLCGVRVRRSEAAKVTRVLRGLMPLNWFEESKIVGRLATYSRL